MGLRNSKMGFWCLGADWSWLPLTSECPQMTGWSRELGAGLGACVLLPPASINQRSRALCAVGSPILSLRRRKSQSCHTGGNAGEQEFLSGCSSHQLILLTKHLAAPLPPWQPLGCSLQRCLRLAPSSAVLCAVLSGSGLSIRGAQGVPQCRTHCSTTPGRRSPSAGRRGGPLNEVTACVWGEGAEPSGAEGTAGSSGSPQRRCPLLLSAGTLLTCQFLPILPLRILLKARQCLCALANGLNISLLVL